MDKDGKNLVTLLAFCLPLLILMAAASAWIPADCSSAGLIWSHNESSSPAIDYCGNSNGTWYGTASAATGRYGNGIQLDAAGEYVYSTTNNYINWENDWTVNFWYKTTSAGTLSVVVRQANVYFYCTQDNVGAGQMYCAFNDGTEYRLYFPVGWYASNEWVMVTAVYRKGVNVTLYHNNTYSDSHTIGTLGGGTTSYFRESHTATYSATGIIDELAIFGKALTLAQVEAIYANETFEPPAPTASTYGCGAITSAQNGTETVSKSYTANAWYNSSAFNLTGSALYWNGTQIGTASLSNSSAGDNVTATANRTFSMPLVDVNSTSTAIAVSFNFTNTTGTYTCFDNSTDYIKQRFYWPDYSPKLALIEGEVFPLDASFTEPVAGVVGGVRALFNNTYYSLAGSGGVYTATATAPSISGYNESFVSNASFFVNFTGDDGGGLRNYTRTSENETIVVYRPLLVNCTIAGSTPTINFSFFDEENLTAIPSDMDSTFYWWSTADHSGANYTGNFSVTSTLTASFCLYPNFTTIYLDSFQVYQDTAEAYRVRNYFLNNASISNTTSVISLFDIPIVDSDLLTVTVEDQLIAVPNAFVRMERYYPGEDLYRVVDNGKTDENGKAFHYPVPNDVYYRFVVVNDYETVYSGDPREIGIDTITLDLSENTELEYFQFLNDLSISCNKTGDIVGCSVVNPSGLDVNAWLYVKQIGIYSDAEICSSNVSAVSGATLLCNVSGYSGAIKADLIILGSAFPAWTESYAASTANVYGDLGLFVSVILVIGGALLLGVSPVLSVIGAILGAVVAGLSGMWAVSLTSMILIIVAGALIIVRSRS